MKYFKLILISFALAVSFSITKAQAQIDLEKLYEKHWRTKTYEFIKPNDTVLMYSRYENKGAVEYGSVVTLFKKNGLLEGFNAAGIPTPGRYKLTNNNEIFFDDEQVPAKIISLTDTELVTEATQLYTPILTSEPYNVTTKIVYEAFDPNAICESLKSGEWDNLALWTCQRVPTINDKVQINQNHRVAIPDNYKAYAQSLNQIGKLKIGENAKLELGKQP
ncbi:hypothetical protein [Spirosoma pulveris]